MRILSLACTLSACIAITYKADSDGKYVSLPPRFEISLYGDQKFDLRAFVDFDDNARGCPSFCCPDARAVFYKVEFEVFGRYQPLPHIQACRTEKGTICDCTTMVIYKNNKIENCIANINIKIMEHLNRMPELICVVKIKKISPGCSHGDEVVSGEWQKIVQMGFKREGNVFRLHSIDYFACEFPVQRLMPRLQSGMYPLQESIINAFVEHVTTVKANNDITNASTSSADDASSHVDHSTALAPNDNRKAREVDPAEIRKGVRINLSCSNGTKKELLSEICPASDTVVFDYTARTPDAASEQAQTEGGVDPVGGTGAQADLGRIDLAVHIYPAAPDKDSEGNAGRAVPSSTPQEVESAPNKEKCSSYQSIKKLQLIFKAMFFLLILCVVILIINYIASTNRAPTNKLSIDGVLPNKNKRIC